MKKTLAILEAGMIVLALCAMTLTFVSCSNGDDTPAFDASLTTTSLGQVLTGSDGKTLYTLAADVAGTSTCTGACATVWPPYYKETLQLGSGLASQAADFGTITRADGTKQLTYKGWPLYSYSLDTAPGQVKGDNVEGVWYVARPHYSVALANAQLVGNDGKNYTSTYALGDGKTTYLVDSLGRTLYAFAPDKKDKNTYTKSDFSNNGTWPLAEFDARNVPSSLNAADFGSITVFGHKQLTYKGWPLYYFGSDNGERGKNKGISVPRTGVWPIVNQNSVAAPAQ